MKQYWNSVGQKKNFKDTKIKKGDGWKHHFLSCSSQLKKKDFCIQLDSQFTATEPTNALMVAKTPWLYTHRRNEWLFSCSSQLKILKQLDNYTNKIAPEISETGFQNDHRSWTGHNLNYWAFRTTLSQAPVVCENNDKWTM